MFYLLKQKTFLRRFTTHRTDVVQYYIIESCKIICKHCLSASLLKENLGSFYLLIEIKETFSTTTISKVFILFSDDKVFSSEVTPLILLITTVIKFSENLRKYETFYATFSVLYQTSLEFFRIVTLCKRGQF